MNDDLTVSAVLGDAPPVKNLITIESVDGRSATASFRPTRAAGPAGNNPKPVEGYAKSEDVARKTASTDVGGLALEPDGRYCMGGAPAPEVIIGRDDRVRVNNPRAWPFSVHGHMVMRFPNGKTFIGSGTLVNKHHVLTAGHCVYSKADGGWATSVVFNAAQNDNQLPFGSASAVRLLSVTGWTQNGDRAHDMGMLILNSDLGARAGWFGVITLGNSSSLLRKRVNVTGYPGDKGGQQMWTHADAIKSVTAENFHYDIDTMGGQSGSGVWSAFAGHQGEKVAGIHTTGASSGNGATRISRPKFDRIVNWFQQY